jgi:membrane dipeptidase
MIPVIDLHCDTLWRVFTYGGCFSSNDYHIDLQKLKAGGSAAQFFAAFIYMNERRRPVEDYRKDAYAMIERFNREIEENPGLAAASSRDDFERNKRNGMVSTFLTIEEGGIIESSQDLASLYDKNVRLITLTWNFPNSLGYPNIDWTYSGKGLTSLGRDIVSEMAHKGILVDVSHLSDAGFWDTADIMQGPFLASHSCCRTLTHHPRNLTDKMIKAIADHHGVVGVNFSASFLGTGEKGTIEGIIAHMKHLKKTGGMDICALGSDFDGIFCPLEVKDYSGMPLLLTALKENGFTEEECEKIAFKNALRMIDYMGKEE